MQKPMQQENQGVQVENDLYALIYWVISHNLHLYIGIIVLIAIVVLALGEIVYKLKPKT